MKKILVVILLLAILTSMVSCAEVKEYKQGDFSKKVEFTLTGLTVFSGRVDIIQDMETYISQNYKTNINMSEFTNELDYSFIRPGIHQVRGYHLFEDLMDMKERILPLENYLEKNEVWRSLPEYFKNTFKDSKGHIWAVPGSYNINPTVRYFNPEVYDRMGNDIPNTLDGFFDYLKALKVKFPEKDVIVLKSASLFSDIMDIFYSFGITSLDSHIIYDNFNEEYYCVGTSEGFKEAITYIKALKDEGLITIKEGINNPALTFLSFYNMVQYSPFLMGFNVSGYRYNQAMRNANIAYVLSSNTKKPETIINRFVSIFYDGTDGYLLGRYGTSDKYDYYPEYGMVITDTSIPNIIFQDIFFKDIFGFTVKEKNDNAHVSSLGEKLNDTRKTYISDIAWWLDSGRISTMNEYNLKSYENSNFPVPAKFFSRIFTEDVRVDELIAEYESLCKKYGIYDMVKQMNNLD